MKLSTLKPNKNKLIINAGCWRSRVVTFPNVVGLRPTPNRVRETVFNWLGQTLHNKICLDAFAGSGALGFEAASRGASHVVMCESNTVAAASLTENAKRLNSTNIEIIKRDVLQYLASQRLKFDVVFCDPPFDAKLYTPFLGLIQPFLAEDARLYWESAIALDGEQIVLKDYEVVKSSKAGAVYFGLLRRKASS
jgi:16S rRNA (guanine966-N2)-methyltransferase